MTHVCQRCYAIVSRACQNDTETLDCPNLNRSDVKELFNMVGFARFKLTRKIR